MRYPMTKISLVGEKEGEGTFLSVSRNLNVEIREAWNPVLLSSGTGERLLVTMLNDGFSIEYQPDVLADRKLPHTVEFRNGKVRKVEELKEDDNE